MMASGDEDRTSTEDLFELDAMAQRMVNGSEQDLQGWAEAQDLGRLRTLPTVLLRASAEHERRAKDVSTLAFRIREVLAAASRGYALNEEPQKAEVPALAPSMGGPVPASEPWGRGQR